ncbi:MAG: hypothetical protein FWE38_01675 [Firmicutes bacterium]|nr:hypothetical protein [Bacillota bacterium]
MTKKIIVIVLAVIFIGALHISLQIFVVPSLLADSPPTYTISTREELANIAQRVNSGETFAGVTLRLANDIDLRGEDWVAIGGGPMRFSGTFDGGGFEIVLPQTIRQEVNISAGMDHQFSLFGLFGRTENATIRNVNLRGDVINWTSSSQAILNLRQKRVGMLVGSAVQTSIENVHVVGHLSNIVAPRSEIIVGGVVGVLVTGAMQNVTNRARINVIATEQAFAHVGGIVGGTIDANLVHVANFGNISEVIAGTYLSIGGIVGLTYPGSSRDGSTLTTWSSRLGLYNFANHGNIHADLMVTGANPPQEARAGGIVGLLTSNPFIQAPSELMNGYNRGTVNIIGNATHGVHVGGIVGDTFGPSHMYIDNVFTTTRAIAGRANSATNMTSAFTTIAPQLVGDLNNRRAQFPMVVMMSTTVWERGANHMPMLYALTDNLEPPVDGLTFTVTFLDRDNQPTYVRQIPEGSRIYPIEAPTIPYHLFLYWRTLSGDDMFTAITGDTVFLAIYNAIPMSRMAVVNYDTGGVFDYFYIIRGTSVHVADLLAIAARIEIPAYHAFEWVNLNTNTQFIPTNTDRNFYFRFTKIMAEVEVNFFTLARINLDEEANERFIIKGLILLGVALTATIITHDVVHSVNSHIPPVDMVVRMTHTITAWVGDIQHGNLCPWIPNGIFGRPAHNNIPGWEFTGWQNIGGRFVATYNKPQVAVRYFGSNNAYITTRHIDFVLAPVTEMQPTGWWARIREALRETFINWSLFAALNSNAQVNALNNLIQGLADLHTVGEFEIFFLMVNPDLHVQDGWGVFGASGASVRSPFFRWAGGTPESNDYLMWADFSNTWVMTPRWEIIVTYNTPWDTGLNFLANIWNTISGAIGWLADGGLWWIVAVVLLILFWPLVPLLVALLLWPIRKLVARLR